MNDREFQLKQEILSYLAKYKDPFRVRRIFEEYLQDIMEFGKINFAISVLQECKNSVQLECRLDTLISNSKKRLQMYSGSAYPAGLDIDAQGYYTIALKALEEVRAE